MFCTKCHGDLPTHCFRKRNSIKRGYQSWCKDCEYRGNRNRYVKHPRIPKPKKPYSKIDAKDRMLKHRYGFSVNKLKELYLNQNGRCAICDKQRSMLGKVGLYIDHNHKTGKIRGLLCPSCNAAIGQLHEDENLFRKAIDYINNYT